MAAASPKLAFCVWLDINNNQGPWVELPDSTRPSVCFTFGWLIHDEPDFVTVSSTYSDHVDDGPREAMMTSVIPRCCITKLEVFTLDALLAQQS